MVQTLFLVRGSGLGSPNLVCLVCKDACPLFNFSVIPLYYNSPSLGSAWRCLLPHSWVEYRRRSQVFTKNWIRMLWLGSTRLFPPCVPMRACTILPKPAPGLYDLMFSEGEWQKLLKHPRGQPSGMAQLMRTLLTEFSHQEKSTLT